MLTVPKKSKPAHWTVHARGKQTEVVSPALQGLVIFESQPSLMNQSRAFKVKNDNYKSLSLENGYAVPIPTYVELPLKGVPKIPSWYVGYAMLMRPIKADTAVRGCQLTG